MAGGEGNAVTARSSMGLCRPRNSFKRPFHGRMFLSVPIQRRQLIQPSFLCKVHEVQLRDSVKLDAN